MATSSNHADSELIEPHRSEVAVVPGRPQEQLQVEEPEPTRDTEDDIDYPTGAKLWLTVICLCLTFFLHGLVSLWNAQKGMTVTNSATPGSYYSFCGRKQNPMNRITMLTVLTY